MQTEKIDRKDLFEVRFANQGDMNFIMATWLRGLYYGDTWFSIIPKDIFMRHYHLIITAILTNSNTIVKVACLKDDPEIILGYCVLNQQGQILHWVFVKKAWRSIGICKSLVPNTVGTVTHLTKTGIGMLKKRQGLVFNPFII